MRYVAIDLTGQKFGKLSVIEKATTNKHGQARWLCQCDCGNRIIVSGYVLRQGQVSCSDCYHTSRITHNMSHNKLYKTWRNMKTRCYNKYNPQYINYGGRGITVCDEWIDNFQAFYEWSMKNGYENDLSIDRIDVNGNYEASNCRWVTDIEQADNKRKTLKFEYEGNLRTINELAEIAKTPRFNIYNRLVRYGWSVERTMSTPIKYKHHERNEF